MPAWLYPFTAIGLAFVAVLVVLALIVLLDPGKGWTSSCMYGSWWRRKNGATDEARAAPRCSTTPRAKAAAMIGALILLWLVLVLVAATWEKKQ